MSFADGKEFVIKDVFTDVLLMKDEQVVHGKTENHFNIPWSMYLFRNVDKIEFYLHCLKTNGTWSIETDVKLNLYKRNVGVAVTENRFESEDSNISPLVDFVDLVKIKNHMEDGKLTVEMHVKIKKLTGEIQQQLKNFDESMNKYTDVVLIVNDEKFYVCKTHLSYHLFDFNSRFEGIYDESGRMVIKLNNINTSDFRNYLEVMYGEPAINEDNVDKIADLCFNFHTVKVWRHCADFYKLRNTDSMAEKWANMEKAETAAKTIEKKRFVIKQVFNDIPNVIPDEVSYAEKESHFNVPWRIGIQPLNGFSVRLDCVNERGSDEWSIETDIETKFISRNQDPLCKKSSSRFVFDNTKRQEWIIDFTPAELEKYLTNGELAVEMHVTIMRMTGIKENLINFDKSMNEFSEEDVVALILDDEKFYVSRMYLASHSPVLSKLLMSKKFAESQEKEIAVQDIDPYYFQKFLEVLHGEPAVNEDTVFDIFHLADFYDSKTAIRRCEQFLIKKSERSLEDKFEIAVKFNRDELKKTLFSDVITVSDIDAIFNLAAKHHSKLTIQQCEEFLLNDSTFSSNTKLKIAIKYNLDKLKEKCDSEMKIGVDMIPEPSV